MTTIDRSSWPREDVYRFFASMSNPFFALTFPVEVTALRKYVKEKHLSFYTALVFLVTKAMEDVEAFRLRDRDGVIVCHDRLVPSFTDLKPGSSQFHIVTLEAGDDLEAYCLRAKAQSAAQEFFVDDSRWTDELVYFTCLPWFPITGAVNERDSVPADAIPRVTWGRWEEREGRTLLSLSLEANHRLVDGVHVGKLYEALTARLTAL